MGISRKIEAPIRMINHHYNSQVSNQAFYQFDLENLKNLYERLLASKEAELVTERKLLATKEQEILLLKAELLPFGK